MRALRLLALTMISFALLVQGAAYASARPAEPPAKVSGPRSDCEEMSDHHEMAPAGEQKGKGACPDMRLGCLVAMGCLAPLIAIDDLPTIAAAGPAESLYAPLQAVAVLSLSGGPEPPPPQAFA